MLKIRANAFPFALWFIGTAFLLMAFALPSLSVAATFFGPTPYLPSAVIPVGLYAGGSPGGLEDFEDRSLDFGISVSGGQTLPPLLPDRVDSVDGDDGVIDGSGSGGSSWFIDDLGGFAELTFSFATIGGGLPTAAGIVWTDGAANHEVLFEAFGPGMVSLGVLGPFGLGDAVNTGQTSEDRFFGVLDAGGIEAIRLRNQGAAGGIEVDHVQFGAAVPEPSAAIMIGLGLVMLARNCD